MGANGLRASLLISSGEANQLLLTGLAPLDVTPNGQSLDGLEWCGISTLSFNIGMNGTFAVFPLLCLKR